MKNLGTVLVTGGAGFIGSNLIRKLLTKPHTSIHILSEPSTSLWRLNGIQNEISVHSGNMADFTGIQNIVKHIKPTTIFHLAAFGGQPNESDPQTVYNVNFLGTMNLLAACKTIGFDCFINTGSSSEYGMKSEPMNETINLEPVSDYGVAKAAATHYCLKEALVNKLPIYTVRPFSVYGDYEMAGRLVPTLLVGALTQQPIKLSSPHFVRDFIYIKDMIDLYCAVVEQSPTQAYVFNGGTGIQSKIIDAVTTTESIINNKLTISWGEHTARPWEPDSWYAGIARSYDILGWQAHHSLREGLEASLVWFKNNLHHYAQDNVREPRLSKNQSQSSSLT